jgi:hypothetical protein
MSTPAGKPKDPVELAGYVSHKARERDRSKGGAEPPFSSESSPSTAPEHGEEPRRDWKPGDAAASASSSPHLQPHIPTDGQEEAVTDAPKLDAGPPERGPPAPAHDAGSARGAHARPFPTTLPQGEPRPLSRAYSHPRDLDEGPPLQPGQMRMTAFHEPAAKPDNKPFSEDDLDRLEASLRWLQHQEASLRLPRGPTLPPVQGLPAEPRGRRYGDDVLARGARAARSLEPERMAPPPAEGGRRLPTILALLSACFALAALGYYLAPVGPRPEPVAEPRLASVHPTYTPPVKVERPEPLVAPVPEERSAAVESSSVPRQGDRQQDAAPPLPETAPPVPPAAAPQPEPPAAAAPQPDVPEPVATVAPAPPAPPKPQRTIDPEEVKLLMRQGEQFIASGDLITARKLFQRAAEAGDAAGAIALGATYDPVVLERLGVVGIAAADVEKARTWYQVAERLGSREASRRLQILAKR